MPRWSVTKVGAAPVRAKAAMPSACEPESEKAVSVGPAESAADGRQPAEADTKVAPAAHEAQAALP